MVNNLQHLSTPEDFRNRHGLGFLHFNARSLVPKMDIFNIWFLTAKPDIVIVSESWLKPAVPDNVHITGYNIFRTDRKGRAGGVLMYISEHLRGSLLHSISIPRQFENGGRNISGSITYHCNWLLPTALSVY